MTGLRVLSYVVTALAPLILYLIASRVAGWRRAHRLLASFWAGQGRIALEGLGVLERRDIPRPLRLLEDRWANETALTVVSTAREHGVLQFLAERPGATLEEVAQLVGFSTRHVSAGIEVLRAADVVDRCGAGYALTDAARFYLFHDSPFRMDGLPPPVVSRRMLRILRSGAVPGSVARWATGRSHQPKS